MTDGGYSLKVAFKDQNRRFLLPDLDYGNLLAMAADRFGFEDSDALYFHHRDPDGDLVTISSSEELAEAMRLLAPAATLRLILAERDGEDDDVTADEVPVAAAATSATKAESVDKDEKRKLKEAEKMEKKRVKAKRQKEQIAKIVAEVLAKQVGVSPAPSVSAGLQTEPPSLLSYRSPSLDTRTDTPQPDATPAAGAPSEEHLRSLLSAAVSALELDGERVEAALSALSPEQVRASLGPAPPMLKAMLASFFFPDTARPAPSFPCPFPFGGPWGSPPPHPPPSSGSAPPPPPPPPGFGAPPPPPFCGWGGAPSFPPGAFRPDRAFAAAFGGAREQPQHPRRHGRSGCPFRRPGPRGDSSEELPAVPEEVLSLDATGRAVAALHRNLAFVGYLPAPGWCGRAPRFSERTAEAVAAFQRDHNVTPVEAGVFDADTRHSLVSKVEAVKQQRAAETKQRQAAAEARKGEAREAEAKEAEAVSMVEVTDTDGDVMLFVLLDGRVQEFVNGALEIDAVSELALDPASGRVVDCKGSFTVVPEHRPRLPQLVALLQRVGAAVRELAPAPAAGARTVVVDVDLNAPAEEQAATQTRAEAAVKAACDAMGADPDAAMARLRGLFAAAPAYATAMAGPEAGEALAAGLARAGEEVEALAAALAADDEHREEEKEEEQEEEEEQVAEEEEEAEESGEEFVCVGEPTEAKEEEEEEEEQAKGKSAAGEDAAVWGEYDEAIVQLVGMGLCPDGPTPELIALLAACDGDVSRAVDRILASV